MSGECVVIGPHGRISEAQAVPYDGRLRHFLGGPADLIRLPYPDHWKFTLTYQGAAQSRRAFLDTVSPILFDPAFNNGSLARWQREGMTYTAEPTTEGSHAWRFSWYFRGGGSSVPILGALQDEHGWRRAGVHIMGPVERGRAHVEVQIVPSIPNYPQAAGLYRWGQGRPEILLVARYLNDPSFGTHLVNHEFGHAVFRIYDLIPERGFPAGIYRGIMDYVGIEERPIDSDIEGAQLWLEGRGVVQ